MDDAGINRGSPGPGRTLASSGGAAGRTHVGRIRDHNEDAYLLRAPLFVVADGMGGHRAGEVASAHAVDELRGALEAGRIESGADLVRALQDAHAVIVADAQRNPPRRGMGTTCVAMLIGQDVTHVAHIGDSRAYLLRAGRLERLTEDHSLVAALVREGSLREEDAERDPRRHIVLRALGADDEPRPDLREIPLRAGDRLLLCSDGLSGVVAEHDMATLLANGTPSEAADGLVARTLDLGAPDNVTVIVVDPDGLPRQDQPAAAPATAGRPGPSRRRRARSTGALAIAGLVVAGGGLVGLGLLAARGATPVQSTASSTPDLLTPAGAQLASPGGAPRSPEATPAGSSSAESAAPQTAPESPPPGGHSSLP